MSLDRLRARRVEARHQRRLFREHCVANEPTTDGDREFFERHPERQYRLRPASSFEDEFTPRGGATPQSAFPFAVIRNIGPGIRQRAIIDFREAPAFDDEATARAAYEKVLTDLPQAAEIARGLEAIARAAGR
jgi:hypothetical protein